MAPQDDLTAAAEQLYKRLFVTDAYEQDDRIVIAEALQQTRQEALREAADIAFDHACDDPRSCMCNSVIHKQLDRLASEGG